MSISTRKKEKYKKHDELYVDEFNEGTAARTRPLSFDEIMFRRKNKKQPANVKESLGGKETIEKVTDCSESERCKHDDSVPSSRRHASEDFLKENSMKKEDIISIKDGTLVKDKTKESQGSENMPKENSRKKDDSTSIKDGKLMKDKTKEIHSSINMPKENSRKKYDSTFIKDGKLVKDKTKESYGSENKTEDARNKNVSDEAKGDKIGQGSHNKRKNNERLTDDFEYDTEKRHSRHLAEKDRYNDRSREKFGKESKRKHQNEGEKRGRERSTPKKHDSGRRHDSELSQRKEKDSSKVHHVESRWKRRRSRSRERDRERDRKSISLSPRAHKHASYGGREHGDLPSHSSRDKSERSHPDIDRNRLSSNGSSSHYRRHGGSEGRLGGYSPRKRRTEAAVKTPSPAARSPEKRTAGWDLPPTEAGSKSIASVHSNLQSSKQTVPSNAQEISSAVPAGPIVAKPVFGSFPSISSSVMNSSIDSIQLTQATRPMRRLYVENVPASVSEKDVIGCLNNFLLSSGVNHVKGTQPCISCIMHKEKGLALVEFLTPEDASVALSFDGRSFCGSVLKIRRPKDFVEVTTGIPERSEVAIDSAHDNVRESAVNSISDTVRDSPDKIFVGGISKIISSETLMEIAAAFGTLKSYRFEFNADLKEPCAFLEYLDESVTLKACVGLNGMSLGGKVITVVQATPDASSMETSGSSPFYGIPVHARPLLEKPTKVLKLNNVLNPEALSSLSEAELAEILEDIRLECARFGTVKSINVVRHGNSSPTGQTSDITDNTADIVNKQDLESDDKDKRTENLIESMDFDLARVDRLECSDADKETAGGIKIAEGSSTCDSEHNESVRSAKGPEEGNTNSEQNNITDEKLSMSALLSSAKDSEEADTAIECTDITADKVDRLGASNDSKEAEVNKTTEYNDMTDYRVSGLEPSVSSKEPQEVKAAEGFGMSETTSTGNSDFNGDDPTYFDEKVAGNIQPDCHEEENKPLIEDVVLEEWSKKSEQKKFLLDTNIKMESEAPRAGESKQLISDAGNAFEPGCILIEYARTEASCQAAHCLHGRLFDGRIVTVGYIDQDSYWARFAKRA